MININVTVKSIVRVKETKAGILAHLFVKVVFVDDSIILC